jgi:hypothetical protein
MMTEQLKVKLEDNVLEVVLACAVKRNALVNAMRSVQWQAEGAGGARTWRCGDRDRARGNQDIAFAIETVH